MIRSWSVRLTLSIKKDIFKKVAVFAVFTVCNGNRHEYMQIRVDDTLITFLEKL